MNDTTTAVATNERRPNALTSFRKELDGMAGQFEAALPAHIPAERFARVVMTAVQNNPDLLSKADRRSLWNAAMRAAQDGLLPDGREGAMVLFGSQAQWMPMIGGLRKKVRNSGEIATWDVHVVHENDEFEFELGDEPYIKHRPTLDEPGRVIAAYSVATLKSGEKSREVMSIAQIEKVRSVSRAKAKGPWVDWYEEMCRKTVARRHAKSLPMATDLDDLIRRDDELYDMQGAKAEAQAARPTGLAGKLDALAATPFTPAEPEAQEAEDAADDVPAAPTTDAAATVEQPATDPQPAPQTAEVAPTAPAEPVRERADDAPLGLSVDEKKLLRRLAEALSTAMQARTIGKGFDAFVSDHKLAAGTAAYAGADRIRAAHLKRVNGATSPAEADQEVARALA